MTTSPTAASLLPEVVVAGTPEAMGEAHGETLRSLIGEVYAWRIGEIRAVTGEPEAAVLDRAARHTAAAEAHLPQIVAEVDGIGRGSGLGFRRAFFLQVATEVSLEPVAGCSAIGVVDVEGGPIVAQNWDQPIASAGKQVVVRFRPSDRPEVLMFGHAGVVGYIGLNEHGVGHVGNQLYSSEARRADGLTQYFINRRLLEFDSVEPALAWLTSVPIASTCNYLLGDASGALADVELGAGRATVQGRGRSLTHTNHYLVDIVWSAPTRTPMCCPIRPRDWRRSVRGGWASRPSRATPGIRSASAATSHRPGSRRAPRSCSGSPGASSIWRRARRA